ncbi:hypothetical protein J4416_03705 [Candidatus Pacearchaeota archaeon]|nr:hypothetical protein [Candidatus Pacearchaeota archaeon]
MSKDRKREEARVLTDLLDSYVSGERIAEEKIGIGIRPNGYWTIWENIEKELKEEIENNNGEFPGQRYLTKAGKSSVSRAISIYHGGFREVRKKMGYSIGTQDPKLISDFSWLRQQLQDIIDKDNGEFPNDQRIVELGRRDLRWGIWKYHGGYPAVRKKMGYESKSSSVPVKDWKVVRKELEKIIAQNKGEFPSSKNLVRRGRKDLLESIQQYYGGIGEVQRRMGYEPKLTKYEKLRDWEYIKGELEAIMGKNNGVFPSQKHLNKIGRSGLWAVIQEHHGGMNIVRAKLGKSLKTKPKELLMDWSWLKGELEAIIEENAGEFPPQLCLQEIGRTDISNAIKKYHGGFPAVRKKMGHQLVQNEYGLVSDWKWVSKQLKQIIDGEGKFPSTPRLIELDRGDLIGAIARHHGGINAVRKRLGYEPAKKSKEQLSDWNWVQREFEKIIREDNGKFPTQRRLGELRKTHLQNAVTLYHGGINAARQRMGYSLPSRPKGYLTNWENLESELLRISKELGHFPSKIELVKLRESSIAAAITLYHGGFKKVRELIQRKIGVRPESEHLGSLLETYVNGDQNE